MEAAAAVTEEAVAVTVAETADTAVAAAAAETGEAAAEATSETVTHWLSCFSVTQANRKKEMEW